MVPMSGPPQHIVMTPDEERKN